MGGGKASYHYEELATFCYKYRVREKENALLSLEKIRELFVANLEQFRLETGCPCVTVASHGYYVNTKIGVQNHALMNDKVRSRANILREAYDKERMSLITCRLADQVLCDNFTREAICAIERGEHVIELLTHPRQWNSPFFINLKEEIQRLFKQLYMRL